MIQCSEENAENKSKSANKSNNNESISSKSSKNNIRNMTVTLLPLTIFANKVNRCNVIVLIGIISPETVTK